METAQSPLPGHSPLPMAKEAEIIQEMNFSEAIAKVLEDKKITRSEWENTDIYGFLEKEVLKIKIDGKDHEWILSEGDLAATDWVII